MKEVNIMNAGTIIKSEERKKTEKALADAAAHRNLYGPFKSGKDLIEHALKS